MSYMRHSIFNGKAPVTIQLPTPVLRKMELYIKLCPVEISGFGRVEVQPGKLLVPEIFLFEQESSMASTTPDPQAVNAFVSERLMRGDDIQDIKLWWHSHGPADVYWSSTDETAIEQLGHSGWYISIVGNHAGAFLARLDIFPSPIQPFRVTLPAMVTEKVTYSDEDCDVATQEIFDKVRIRDLEPLSRVK